jgi:hypothetical protein
LDNYGISSDLEVATGINGALLLFVERVAVLPIPNTPSWRGAELKHRDSCIFTYSAEDISSSFSHSFGGSKLHSVHEMLNPGALNRTVFPALPCSIDRLYPFSPLRHENKTFVLRRRNNYKRMKVRRY